VNFLHPIFLLALLSLPLLWLIIRNLPPPAATIRFPAFFLLPQIGNASRISKKSPLWLLLFRILLAAIIIFLFSRPYLKPDAEGYNVNSSSNLLIVIDDSFSAAQYWPEIIEKAKNVARDAEANSSKIALVRLSDYSELHKQSTKPEHNYQNAEQVINNLSRQDGGQFIDQKNTPNNTRDNIIAPQPITNSQINFTELAEDIAKLSKNRETIDQVFFLNSGVSSSKVDDDSLKKFIDGLENIAATTVFIPKEQRVAVIRDVQITAENVRVSVGKPINNGQSKVFLQAFDAAGEIIGSYPMELNIGKNTDVEVNIPDDVRNNVDSFTIAGQYHAGAKFIVGGSAKIKSVGLACGDSSAENADSPRQPLLDESYYIHSAFKGFARVKQAAVSDLIRSSVSIIVMCDSHQLEQTAEKDEHEQLQQWIEDGGTLVRFAGSRMANQNLDAPISISPTSIAPELTTDALLPVKLGSITRYNGLVTWQKPQGIKEFSANSPLAKMKIDKDIRIKTLIQAAADMESDLAIRGISIADAVWAELEDGSPLITGSKLEEGNLVLIHTSSTPEWSNLPLSITFVEILQRLYDISEYQKTGNSEQSELENQSFSATPISLMDGFGNLRRANNLMDGVSTNFMELDARNKFISPGVYQVNETDGNSGSAPYFIANLSQPQTFVSLGNIEPVQGKTQYYSSANKSRDLSGYLAYALLLMLCLDALISVMLAQPRMRQFFTDLLRQNPSTKQTTSSVALFAAIVMVISSPALTSPALAEGGMAADADNPVLNSPALMPKLAYVKTGNSRVDDISRLGISTISEELSRRTSFNPGAPVAVDINLDDISLYPLLYWPYAEHTQPITAESANRLRTYIRSGGMIILDSQDGANLEQEGGRKADFLAVILKSLNIGELSVADKNHVLGKTFYLLDSFPGRVSAYAVLLEKPEPTVNDGVSPVIIGSSDWAGAWARGSGDGSYSLPMLSANNQINPQLNREYAIRAGVNFALYALTGNYKNDMIHNQNEGIRAIDLEQNPTPRELE
jgi:hypothetical protein